MKSSQEQDVKLGVRLRIQKSESDSLCDPAVTHSSARKNHKSGALLFSVRKPGSVIFQSEIKQPPFLRVCTVHMCVL